MTIQELIDTRLFTPVCVPKNTCIPISTPFCCDLLSIAMSRAPQGCAWVTVMANINTLAVASLTECACIILAEGTAFDETCLQKAATQNIAVFTTDMSIFDAALSLWKAGAQNTAATKNTAGVPV